MSFPGVPGKKNSVNYECCPEPYVDITFTIHIGSVLILIYLIKDYRGNKKRKPPP
jgi:hypothetical protein